MQIGNIPRPEYPRPQMVRDDWMNLNGEWDFEIDNALSGRERGLPDADALSDKIIVPFCPESRLSGIGHTDFMQAVWYTRTFDLPAPWQREGRRTVLHIGACDYRTEVWINGQSVGEHTGGYASFSFDISPCLQEGRNRVTICALDNVRGENQPAGKQSAKYGSFGCFYTRTTGIWQTVWLENTSVSFVDELKLTPCLERNSVILEAVCRRAHGFTLTASAAIDGKPAGQMRAVVVGGTARMELPLSERRLWTPESPALFSLQLTLADGDAPVDTVKSYFGMREIVHQDGKFFLNGKPVFQRLVLDQGYYPDGLYTAPSDADLEADILRGRAMGFNGARLHEKVFEERYLYHCDRLGYMVWGEYANWGQQTCRPEAWENFMPEWLAVVKRDYNHPAIVGWCPINESHDTQNPNFVRFLVELTKAYDGTRPVIDASGWCHVKDVMDILDIHDYEQDLEIFRERYDDLAKGQPIACGCYNETDTGFPTFVSEYGGVWWSDADREGWGYGTRPATKAEALERICRLTEILLACPAVSAFCYTQLTDVEQEQNGLYTYDRVAKFPPEVITAVVSQRAAIETENFKQDKENGDN
jgi:beta-galactosidase/beta-glucuronidase